jgi:hypothetical protein
MTPLQGLGTALILANVDQVRDRDDQMRAVASAGRLPTLIRKRLLSSAASCCCLLTESRDGMDWPARFSKSFRSIEGL